MKIVKYERKRHVIRNLETRNTEDHKTVSRAKKESKILQMGSDGALGRGSLRVVG